MRESRKLLHGTVVLTVGQVVAYGLSFLRNLILARILAKADYGLAAVFGMALTLLEVGGRMAFGIQVIQSKEGDTTGFQDSAHALQFIGGVCSAVLIAGLSRPVAHLFGVPQTWWAFALLAVVPLCQGLGHLDISRRQRELDYLPLVLVDVVPQALITLAAWPLALWLRDFRVIVWLIIAKAVAGTAMTFVFARRPYRWAWERERLRCMLLFGWPLLLNGLVMFGCQQADQMLVGAVFSLDVLASYALAYSLVSIPWFIFGQVGSALMLPILSRAQDDPERLRRQYRVCVQAAAAAGVISTVPLILIGEPLVTLLYGGKYHGTGVFVALLGAAFAVRFLRFVPAVVAVAKADTINQLYSNLWRGASLPLALAVVAVGGTPVQIAACAVVAEVLAAVVSAVLLWRRQGVPLRESYGATIYVIIFVSIGLAVALLGGANLGIGWAAVVGIGAFFIALGSARFMSPEAARLLIEAVRQRSSAIVGQSSLK
jgi:O-antigen/teichoic acid export membrane protein